MNDEITTSWHSYPKSFAIGHRILKDLCLGPVIVEEKIDGSQFSFGIFNGELKCRSKGATLNIEAPDKMFEKAVNVAKNIAPILQNGWTYRGEYLQKPKHNTLVYSRIPANHIIGFDINTGHEQYMSYSEKLEEFVRIGLETVPLLFEGMLTDYTTCRELLETISVLGAQKIEGVVVKNPARFAPDGKILIGKFVSEDFKEVHNGDWRERNPGKADVLETLISQYTTPARWQKSVQHLTEKGLLLGDPRDIGPLIKEVQKDIQEECALEIKEKLFEWAWSNISRGVSRGLPQWYKDQLLKSQFNNDDGTHL